MRLRDFFSPDAISLDIGAKTKPEAISALVALLKVAPETSDTLLKLLDRREQLGSTGVGHGIAIPHCRTVVIPQLRLAFGRTPAGIPFDAVDGEPVRNLFLIVAPPVEVSNLYLPVLGRLAQFAQGAEVPDLLAALKTTEDFYQLLDQRGS